jgi:L-ascorbate metabolism protein UlaG (beta-lactamase superfamily)
MKLTKYEHACVVAEKDGTSIAIDPGTFSPDVAGLSQPFIPSCANVGFLLDGSVYHPGDAYHVPKAPVTTLLLPTSGPWMKFGETIDYVRAVQPQQTMQIHESLLSETGQKAAGSLLGDKGPTRIPMVTVAVGQSLTV